jgi:Glycosyl hydrolase family 79 C-terminal beta domain
MSSRRFQNRADLRPHPSSRRQADAHGRTGVNRAVVIALAVGACALGVSVLFLALSGGSRNQPLLRVAHSARRLTAGEGAPALAPLRLTIGRHVPVLTATIGADAAGIAVPRSFFGLSTEYWALPRYERNMRLFERILAAIHVRGDGPLILRVGGGSADRAYWEPTKPPMYRTAFELTPAWLAQTRTFVQATGTRLILDLNLLANSTAMAVRWARAATAALPSGTITGFEIGNEPDLYHHYFRRLLTERTGIERAGIERMLAPPGFTPRSYAQVFSAYARALARVAPGVPMLGPGVANPSFDPSWISRLLAHVPRAVGMVTAHRYPLSQCSAPVSPRHPTIPRVLSEGASAGMARSVRPAVVAAHRAGLKFRLTEMNSVTCGGAPGVSDTFATALWAPDALFELLRNGVDGLNLHVRSDSLNAPFPLVGSGVQVRPLFYGMILFARTLGPRARLLPAHVIGRRDAHVKVWAVRVAGRTMRVLVINKGAGAANVVLRLRGGGTATVERLLAPSVSASTGVTLAGQTLNGNAEWRNPRAVETLSRSARGYRVTMPGASAALVSVPLTGRG